MGPVRGAVIRRRLRVEGVVQGIGFRPHAHRLAGELGLAGWVRNDSAGVEIEVEGPETAVGLFVERLRVELPPMGQIGRLEVHEAEATGELGFSIESSEPAGDRVVPITPDAHVCEDCLGELRDPSDRHFRYPFVNCTRCGPRFTIVVDVPYDRAATTMSAFEMCEDCRREYEDPSDRRFHAQPVACPACGPRLYLLRPDGTSVPAEPLWGAREALLAGWVVAVKGIGGFHLAVRADDEAAVSRLRERKGREGKPLAVMVRDLEEARTLAVLGPEEEALLESVPRPIVLARARPGGPLATAVAPGLDAVGLMLPCSPLHHLLVEPPMPPLVMTSGNPSEEPIVTRDDEALRTLGPIADLLLLHDRAIQTGCDDSVVEVVRGRPRLLRRSRGHVPRPIEVPGLAASRPILAVGGELKGALCVVRGRQLVMGRHLGDLVNARAEEAFVADLEALSRILGVRAAVVAHDLHPDYATSRFARRLEGVELVAVQHHHAHFAACMADRGLRPGERLVAAVLDGTGYGSDGTIWGGELLVGGYEGFRRAAHLRPIPLPGGDQAVRQPYRTGLSCLVAAFGEAALDLDLPLVRAHEWRHLEDLVRMTRAGLNSPLSSGAGRLFDAAAAIAGLRSAVSGAVSYEAQAAMELQAAAADLSAGPYAWGIDGDEIDWRPTVRELALDVLGGAELERVAARFHATVADMVVEVASRIASAEGLDKVALSGGCFANRRLATAVEAGLEARGLEAVHHERVPPGDGGLALGQAAVACTIAGG